MTTSLAIQTRLWLLYCLLCVSSLCFAENQVLIITTSESNYQQQLANTIKAELKGTPYVPTDTKASLLSDDNIANKELVIAIGKDSVNIIKRNSYRMAILKVLTESSKNTDASERPVNESIIYMTQPLCRQFRLIKALNPNWKTVGLLLSAENDTRASTLSACARKYGLSTLAVTVDNDSDLITALNTALNNSDVLLSLPDPAIYNSHTIKNLLLTSYRHRVPIIGFSESFASAGAIAAVHTSAKQLGTQIAQIVRDYFSNNKSFQQAKYYPSDFTVTTNQQVSRSLGLKIEKEEVIKSILINMEPANE